MINITIFRFNVCVLIWTPPDVQAWLTLFTFNPTVKGVTLEVHSDRCVPDILKHHLSHWRSVRKVGGCVSVRLLASPVLPVCFIVHPAVFPLLPHVHCRTIGFRLRVTSCAQLSRFDTTNYSLANVYSNQWELHFVAFWVSLLLQSIYRKVRACGATFHTFHKTQLNAVFSGSICLSVVQRS